jgi:hypothetical protein
MVLISVHFESSAYFNYINYHLGVKIGDMYFELKGDTSVLAHLINKYATKITVDEGGYGYSAEVPDSVALAVEYLASIRRSTKEEVEEIVRTGTTKLHKFAEELGLSVEGRTVSSILSTDMTFQNLRLCLIDYPTLTLSLCEKTIKFRSEGTGNFLRRLMRGGATEDEMSALEGISLLGERAQEKYMRKLAAGTLSKKALAVAVHRSLSSSKSASRETIKEGVEWLKKNGHEEKAAELIVKKVLCEGGCS